MPITPARDPETWPKIVSTTCKPTPSFCRPVATVRQIVNMPLGNAWPRLSFAASASRSPFALENPDTDVFPLVVKTNSLPAMRGKPLMMVNAGRENGMLSVSLFLVRTPSSRIVSPSISGQRNPLISVFLAPVRISSWVIQPNGHSRLAAARQINTSSASASTLSRLTTLPGLGKSAMTFASMMPRPTDHLNSRCKWA